MTTINLKDFYKDYVQDEFVEVPDEVAAELIADKKHEKAYNERVRCNKAYYTIALIWMTVLKHRQSLVTMIPRSGYLTLWSVIVACAML